MSKTALSIDDVRAQFAKSTQTYWVCPITQKRIAANDTAAIEAHQAKVIADLESKERAKARTRLLREMSSELGKLDSLEALRDWALRRVRLDVGAFLAADMPAMSVHLPKGRDANARVDMAYVRLQGGAVLTQAIKNALSARQGKSVHKSIIGKGVDNAWFIALPLSSGLGRKIEAWANRSAKKLTMQEKEALLASNPEYRENTEQLKALSAQIHALRDQARALVLVQEEVRNNALTALPKDLL